MADIKAVWRWATTYTPEPKQAPGESWDDRHPWLSGLTGVACLAWFTWAVWANKGLNLTPRGYEIAGWGLAIFWGGLIAMAALACLAIVLSKLEEQLRAAGFTMPTMLITFLLLLILWRLF